MTDKEAIEYLYTHGLSALEVAKLWIEQQIKTIEIPDLNPLMEAQVKTFGSVKLYFEVNTIQ